MNEEEQSGSGRIGLVVALLAGLILRLWGLSHDLHTGREYHPDIPKQVRAVERYLEGNYYHHTGLSDYDGYPLFHAHLAEYLCRGYAAAAQGLCDLLGLETRVRDPSLRAIYWIMRLLNVGLSTLAILLVFRIVAPLAGRRPALFGAWLMALSPADMAGAHYGAGDPAAAFFALWCVERSMAVWREGRARDYVVAAFAAVCAFGAKYHAGMCLFPLGLAHLLRQPSLAACVAPASLRRIALLIVTCTAALFLVIPAMFEKPVTVLEEIAAFLSHVSSGDRLAAQLDEDTFVARFAFSMRRNGPVLVDILSWPVIAAALAALPLLLRRERALAILVSLPLVYFLLGVSLRPLAHPVYHVLMTGPLFALAALLGARLWRLDVPYSRSAATFLGSFALLALLRLSAREGFLFQQPDTRRVARDWALENVPVSLTPEMGPYTFSGDSYGAGGSPSGTVRVSSSIRPLPAHADGVRLASFALEARPLPFFRNPAIDVDVCDVREVTAGFRMPLPLPVPSRTGRALVFGSATALLRDGRVVEVEPGPPVESLFVWPAPVSSALAVVRSGAAPVFAELSFGGRKQKVSLGAGESCALWFPNPATAWPHLEVGHLYRSRVQVGPGPAQVVWAFTDAEQGVALAAAGLRKEAAERLRRASDADPAHPSLAALACLAWTASSTDAVPAALHERAADFSQGWSAQRVREKFGLAPDYLDALPYLSWQPDQLVGVGLKRTAGSASGAYGEDEEERPPSISKTTASTAWWLSSPSFTLWPGVYRLDVAYGVPASGTQAVSLAIHDFAGSVVTAANLSATSEPLEGMQLSLVLPRGLSAGRAVLRGAGAGWRFERMALRPDIVASLNLLGAEWRDAQVAAAVAPDADDPQPVAARFPVGLALDGFRLRETDVARGGALGLNLYWRASGFAPRSRSLVAWVHVIDAQGKTRFQGDHRIVENWHRPRSAQAGMGAYFQFPVPADVAPGTYRMVVGLHDERRKRRIEVEEAGAAELDGGVLLPVSVRVR